MNEIWKDIPNYEGMYQVSNLGRVKSLSRWKIAGKSSYFTKEKIIKNNLTIQGYYQVALCKNSVYWKPKVHQLVAICFLNHTPCGMKMVVDHINDNPLDNRVENLQVVTTRYNTCKTQGKYSSQYKGVNWHKKYQNWSASIFVNGKSKWLGSFKNEYDAHLAYQKALSEYK